MLHVGDLLDNKYKILNEIGHGGMSIVYLALNEKANKTWAVKEIRKEGSVDYESVRQGLIVETDMLKKLNHPNLPSIIDVIDLEDSFVIVMDYIEGSSLLKLLKTEGAQPEAKVIKWGKQLCDVFGYLHKQNPPIIYRDMKPANVMLKPSGNVTLIDFGTAREFKNREMVEDTTCLGTRGYAAPEQFGGRGQTDARTDIYCLGATLYHLLTGHSPAEPPYEIKPLSYWIPQYAGSGLEKLIIKCTQQDPSQRYQNCAELMYDLEHYKDQDDILQKQRKRIWRTFVAGLVVAGIGLAGTVASTVALNGAKKDTYEYLIETARSQSTIKDSQTYFKQALQVNAGDAEVYNALLEKAEADIMDQGNLTAETSNVVSSILNSSASGRGSFISSLKEQDPESYTKIMYEIGLWYFFMKGNTEADKRTASSDYFGNIQDDKFKTYLTPGQQELSEKLYKIGGYIGTLDSDINKFGSGNTEDGSYSALFDDLNIIANGDLKSQVEKDIYCIKIYQEIANWINVKTDQFSENGIVNKNQQALLDTVKSKLEALGITPNSKLYADYQKAADTIDNAISVIGRKKGE